MYKVQEKFCQSDKFDHWTDLTCTLHLNFDEEIWDVNKVVLYSNCCMTSSGQTFYPLKALPETRVLTTLEVVKRPPGRTFSWIKQLLIKRVPYK